MYAMSVTNGDYGGLMKKMIMLLCVLSIQASLASETSLKCKSPLGSDVNAEIFFDNQGLMTKISINNEDGWKINKEDDDQTINPNALKLIPEYGILTELKRVSKVKEGTFNKATLKIATSKKPNGPATSESQLDIISDDGSGIAFLQFSSDKNSNAGNALFAGWGGFFYDCK